jgi:hypothetical protein
VNSLEWREFHIAGHTSIIRKSLIAEAGGLLPQLRWHCDWFMQWVLALRYGACYIPEPLATIRVAPHSFSASGTKGLEAQIAVVTEMLDLLRGPCLDVSTPFRRGAILSAFRTATLQALWRNRQRQNQFSSRLVRRSLWNALHRTVADWTPEPIKGMYRPWNKKSISSISIPQQSGR